MFKEMTQEEMILTDGGFVFTATGVALGVKLGCSLAVKYGIKKAVIAPIAATAMGATGYEVDKRLIEDGYNAAKTGIKNLIP